MDANKEAVVEQAATSTAPAEVPAELDRVFNITDGILRSIIVKLEK